MFVDEAQIIVSAGNGGNGSVSFRREAFVPKGGPDGGNGGDGGNAYLRGSHNVSDLKRFRFATKFEAERGEDGSHRNLYGKNGKDLEILLPIGTQVVNVETNQSFEISDETTQHLIATGGKGGRGNNEFKSATNRTPLYAEKGKPGGVANLKLELKLIADVGLIGLPNAGKSSLLSVLTNARPKIGDYPFTTLEPNLGVFNDIVLADIPGLIEGASTGKGLGIQFLKHIQKTTFLLHCIDASSETITKDYQQIRSELETFDQQLIQKPEIIVFTKSDLIDEKRKEELKKVFQDKNIPIFITSIIDDSSLEELKKIIILEKKKYD